MGAARLNSWQAWCGVCSNAEAMLGVACEQLIPSANIDPKNKKSCCFRLFAKYAASLKVSHMHDFKLFEAYVARLFSH